MLIENFEQKKQKIKNQKNSHKITKIMQKKIVNKKNKFYK